MRKLSWIAGMCLVLVACSSREKGESDKGSASSDLPGINLQLVNGSTLDLRNIELPAILVMFQPDCDHCQREAVQIRDNLEAFRDYDLYFISSAPTSEVIQFADHYELSGKENIRFGTTTLESVLNNFGPIPAPSVYIYNNDGKLVGEIAGEVDISVIIDYLQ